MLRTPKERFVSSTHKAAWEKIIQTEPFEEAAHAALEQLATELPMECAIPQIACDSHQQMIGARKYMEILCSLHTPQTTPKIIQRQELDFSAGV
jgi:hypothetical protein